MAKILAELIKPLDGDKIGSTRSFDKADFDRLKKQGAVKSATKPKNKAAKPHKNKSAK